MDLSIMIGDVYPDDCYFLAIWPHCKESFEFVDVEDDCAFMNQFIAMIR